METGLATHHAKQLLIQHGTNEIISKNRTTPFSILISQFPTFINVILFFAAIFAFLIRDFLDASFIFAILILNALFGFFQEYKAEKALEKLKEFAVPKTRVIRDSKQQEINATELVPGDIVVLSEGDRIPADGILIQSHHMELDESILTGESLPVIKQINEPAYLGTLLIKGKGLLKITQTGMNTRFGQIATTLSSIDPDKSPLQKNLAILGKILSIAAIFLAGLLLPINLFYGREFIESLLTTISLSVAAIPEGLPAVITIALALGANRMAKQNAIVRKMPAIETLGAIQVILVDKTGTLTQNSMRVKKSWLYKETNLPFLLNACLLGNTASLAPKSNTTEMEILGDRTDGALLLWASQQDMHRKSEIAKGTIVDEYVFDTKTKTITTVWQQDHKNFVFVRGAPEMILSKSTLPSKDKEHIEHQIETFAKEGYRVIGFGYKHEKRTEKLSREQLENDLEFLGIVGIYDPPRSEVVDAIVQAKTAGIQLVMVTGDNPLTALSIAKEIGLIEKDEDIITGDQLDHLSDDELSHLLSHTRIFARAKPQDKYRLVTLFKKKGLVVGVTGDGVNDALALKKADVGIAMGESGTDVAKEASDIVLSDDNFATLVKAVEEGRVIYHNIVKAITYLLSGNLSEISLVFLATLLGLPAPLLPTHILWINLVTDGLPALALASDTKDPSALAQKPRDPKEPILTASRLKFIGIIGFSISLVLLLAYLFLLGNYSEKGARTITFNLLIVIHLMITFVVRKSITRINTFLIVSILITILLQIIISTTPVFQTIFELGF